MAVSLRPPLLLLLCLVSGYRASRHSPDTTELSTELQQVLQSEMTERDEDFEVLQSLPQSVPTLTRPQSVPSFSKNFGRHDSTVHDDNDDDERTFGDQLPFVSDDTPKYQMVGPAEERMGLYKKKRQEIIKERFAEYDNDLRAVTDLQKKGTHMAPVLEELLPFTIKHLFGMSFHDGYGGCAEKDTVMKSMGDWQYMGCEELYLTPESGPWLSKDDTAPMYIGFAAPYVHVVTKEVRLVVIMRPTVAFRSSFIPPFLSKHKSEYRQQDLADIMRAGIKPKKAEQAKKNSHILVHRGIWKRVERLWPRFCEVLKRYNPSHLTISGLSLGASTASLLALKTSLEARKGAVCGIPGGIWGADRKQPIPLTGLFVSPFPVVHYESEASLIGLEPMLSKLITITAVTHKKNGTTVLVDPIWRMFSDRFSCLGHAVVLPLHKKVEANRGLKGGHAWHYDCRKRAFMEDKATPPQHIKEQLVELFQTPSTPPPEDTHGDWQESHRNRNAFARMTLFFNGAGLSGLIGGAMAGLHCGTVCVPAMTEYELQGGEGLD